MKFQTQLKAAEQYSFFFRSDDFAVVARVTHPLKQRRVDAVTPECSCVIWMQLKVPCHHILAALTGQENPPVISDLISDCYKVTTLQDTAGSAEIPKERTQLSHPTYRSYWQNTFVRQAGRGRSASSHAVKVTT